MSYRPPLVPAIQWHEGMLLSPQHFQQQELRQFQMLSYHLGYLSPYHWGVNHLKFDPVTLPTGVIRILELEAIMPDGLIVSHMAEPEGWQLELDVTPYKAAIQERNLTVFLGVPEYTEGSSPITGEWPRFKSIEGNPVEDENVNDNVIYIPRLLPRLKLIVAEKAPARYVAMPIAKIGFADESFVLNQYEPPCLHVKQTSLVGELLGALVRRLRDKAAYFSDKWQTQIGTPLIGETAQQLRPLLTCLPLLEGLVLSNRTHPYQLYQGISLLSGQLAALRLGQIPPLFPVYDHHHIYASFLPLLDWCNLLLDSLEKAYSILEFTLKDRLFSIMLQPEIFRPTILVGLKAPSTMSEGELADWMRDAIVASESYVETARIRRITGAPRSVIDDQEQLELMPGRGVLIFRIELDPHFVKSGERLCIFNPADTTEMRPTEIVLYLKNEMIMPVKVEKTEDVTGIG
jgi:type VI secretion system protein ImpJ